MSEDTTGAPSEGALAEAGKLGDAHSQEEAFMPRGIDGLVKV